MKIEPTKLIICIVLILICVFVYMYYNKQVVENNCENGVCPIIKKNSSLKSNDSISLNNVENYSLNDDQDIDLETSGSFIIDQE